MNKDFLKLGIIGKPLSHSISPAIQAEALNSVNINGSYEKFEIEQSDLKKQLDFFIQNGFLGFNVTIPYKIDIIKFLTEIDKDAQKIGAINTVKINKNGTTIGYNTDIYGFIQGILSKKELPTTYNNAAILGCGGAALAVIFGLEKLNCKKITIYVRNIEKTQNFINAIKNKVNMEFEIKNINTIQSIENADILINSTPLGTKGDLENEIPINKKVLSTAKKSILIYDLVYNPAETLLIKTAKSLNLNTINGFDMLIYQGAKAFEIWTEKTPSVDKMKKAIKQI